MIKRDLLKLHLWPGLQNQLVVCVRLQFQCYLRLLEAATIVFERHLWIGFCCSENLRIIFTFAAKMLPQNKPKLEKCPVDGVRHGCTLSQLVQRFSSIETVFSGHWCKEHWALFVHHWWLSLLFFAIQLGALQFNFRLKMGKAKAI